MGRNGLGGLRGGWVGSGRVHTVMSRVKGLARGGVKRIGRELAGNRRCAVEFQCGHIYDAGMRTVGFLLGVLLLPAVLRGESWPEWRGPRRDGTTIEKNLPLKWSRPQDGKGEKSTATLSQWLKDQQSSGRNS